jgi:hypothetical protein
MKSRTYSQILDDAAGDRMPAGLDLTPKIMRRIQQGKDTIVNHRKKFITAALVLLLVFPVLFFTVPGVAAAIQNWFGFVPGIGFVREGQIRVLAAPVSQTRDGVTVTVKQVLLDSERTVLTYSVEGIPPEAWGNKSLDECPEKGFLRLPDGTLLPGRAIGGDRWYTGYEERNDYKAIPLDVNNAELVISCLLWTLPNRAPENWVIPLHFIPAPPDLTAFPVIEIPTATLSQAATSISPAISLTLDRAVQMDDGYLIYGAMHWEGEGLNSIDLVEPENTIHLLDAAGQPLVYELVDDENTGMLYDQKKVVFAIRTPSLPTIDPLTIVVDAVSASLPASGSFVLDLGPNPEFGMAVELNEDVKIGDYSIRVVSVTPFQNGYSFEMVSDDGVLGAVTIDLEHPVAGGAGGGGGMSGVFSSSFIYADDKLPQGPVTITISGIDVLRKGPWQTQWTPPTASAMTPSPRPTACLNVSSWNRALKQNPPLPFGLTGKVLVQGPSEPGSGDWEYFLSNLDGSDRTMLPGVRSPSISLDGTRLAEDLADGIYIVDLTTNRTTRVPGTAEWDFNPLWTKDGSQIVFMRGDGGYDLYIVGVDGSGLRRLTNGGGQEWPIGWMSDGRHLLYSVPGPDNTQIEYSLDISTGESREFPVKNVASISPDGGTIITQQNAFGGRSLIFFSGLDGSNPTLLADSDIWALAPVWSPDSQWLVISVSDIDTDHLMPTLVRLDDCTIIPLTQFSGEFMAWGP